MLGDVIELSIVVEDLELAIKRFETLFDLKVHSRGESKDFGFINAILPLGKGHLELIQPVEPSSSVAHFLENHGEGVYLVGFDTEDIAGSVEKLRERGAKVIQRSEGNSTAWVHPKDAHGLFVELRKPQQYS